MNYSSIRSRDKKPIRTACTWEQLKLNVSDIGNLNRWNLQDRMWTKIAVCNVELSVFTAQ